MGGSGGGYFSGPVDPTLRNVKQASSDIDAAEYNAQTNSYLNGLLSDFNDRDVDAINRHLKEIESALGQELEGALALQFGGSVAKHTYVDGLSDVDALVVMEDEGVAQAGPGAALERLSGRLQERFPKTEVSTGDLAVTLKFSDVELQLLPALRGAEANIQIASASGNDWAEIDPRGFARKLTAVNQQNGQKVVPVVKLAKALIGSLPEKQRVTGYHAEAIAVEVFKSYSGTASAKTMLQHFFRAGADRVNEPIRDSTGQSIHVDDYLGSTKSLDRQIVCSAFSRLARRMELADSGQRVDDWRALFGDL